MILDTIISTLKGETGGLEKLSNLSTSSRARIQVLGFQTSTVFHSITLF